MNCFRAGVAVKGLVVPLLFLIGMAAGAQEITVFPFVDAPGRPLVLRLDRYAVCSGENLLTVSLEKTSPTLKSNWYGVKASLDPAVFAGRRFEFSIRAKGLHSLPGGRKGRTKFISVSHDEADRASYVADDGKMVPGQWREMKFVRTFSGMKRAGSLFFGVEGNGGVAEFDPGSLKIRCVPEKAGDFVVENLKNFPVRLSFQADSYTRIKKSGGRTIAVVDLPAGQPVKSGWHGLIAKFPASGLAGKKVDFFIRAKGNRLQGRLKFLIHYVSADTRNFWPNRALGDCERWELMNFSATFHEPVGEAVFFIGIEGSSGYAEFDLSSFRSMEPEALSSEPAPAGRTLTLAATESVAGIPVVPLEDTPRNILPAEFPAGKFHLLLRVRSSDSGPGGKSIYGGYNYWFPENRYRLSWNGEEIPLELSPRTPQRIGRDRAGKEIYCGYLQTMTALPLDRESSLALSCTGGNGFLAELILLTEEEFQLEQLVAGDLFRPLRDGSSVGYSAWNYSIRKPCRVYPRESLDKMIKALTKFPELAPQAERGKRLAESVRRFVNGSEFHSARQKAAGGRLIAEWRGFREECREAIRQTFSGRLRENIAAGKELIRRAEPSSHGGRFAVFWAENAEVYAQDALQAVEEDPEDSGSCDFDLLIHTLSSIRHAETSLRKAQTYLTAGREKVSYPSSVRPIGQDGPEGGGCSASLLLNGMWEYAPVAEKLPPEKIDRLPEKWFPVNIPSNQLTVFHNPKGRDDRYLAKNNLLYHDAAQIRHCWFRTRFSVPEDWRGSRFRLEFQEAAFAVAAFLNGEYVGFHCGALQPFAFDITRRVVPGRENTLLLLITSEREIVSGKGALYPMVAQWSPELRIGGDVTLRAVPAVSIEEVYVQTGAAPGEVRIEAEIRNETKFAVAGRLVHEVFYEGRKELTLLSDPISIPAGESRKTVLAGTLTRPRYWGIGGEYGDPHHRYALHSRFEYGERRSETAMPFAFRHMEIRGRKFFLNGVEFPLQGTSISYYSHNTLSNGNNYHYQIYYNHVLRESYMNFLRFHRFNLQKWSIEACDDAGIVSAGEAPFWGEGMKSPLNIIGEHDVHDPVWRRNSLHYYRAVAKNLRNSPSMLFFSIQNETMKQSNSDVLNRFRRAARELAPHILFYGQSQGTLDSPEDPVAVVHDYGVGYDKIADYAKSATKPFVVGEYWNYQLFKQNSNPERATAALRQTESYFRKTIGTYLKSGVDGVMPYGYETSGVLGSLTSPENFGPWGEINSRKELPRWSVPVVWPARNGSDGYKIPRMIFFDTKSEFSSRRQSYINFWDPSRKVMTLTAAMNGPRAVFRPIPQLAIRRSPALLVTVNRSGAAVSGRNVFVSGPGTLGTGTATDGAGRAYFRLPLSGKYTVSCDAVRTEVTLRPAWLGQAGWDYLDRLELDLDTGRSRFRRGVSSPLKTEAVAPEAKSPAGQRSMVPAAAGGEEVLTPGMPIRRWLIAGPFPNEGERPNCKGFGQDFLGGEAAISPRAGDPLQITFPESATALWEACRFQTSWKPYFSPTAGIDLSRALVQPEVPGLDVEPLTCIVGYAFCNLRAKETGRYRLTVKTYSGIQLWVNGRSVLKSHEHTFSRDPASPVLPPTRLQTLACTVTLKAGVNRILVKNDVDYGDMMFELAADRLSSGTK